MNNHINPVIQAALAPFAPPDHRYTIAVRHANGERGCVLTAADRHDAAIKGLERVALRPDEVQAGGYELRITNLGVPK